VLRLLYSLCDIGLTYQKVDALRILESEFTDLTKVILNDLSPYLSTYNANIILNKRVA
jgi:hypothetical protein